MKHFLSWILWAKRSGLQPFQKVGGIIAGRLNDIVSYFNYLIMNGPQKGMNAKLISVIRTGRNYRHRETFWMAALLFLCEVGHGAKALALSDHSHCDFRSEKML